MPRQANAVDFWRGIALITIFINHIPGNLLGAVHARELFDLGFRRPVRVPGRLVVALPRRKLGRAGCKSTWYLVLRLLADARWNFTPPRS